MWQSMVTHTRNLCSAFNLSKVNTHTRSSGQPFMLRRPWELGVRCLAQEHLSPGIEGGESVDIHSPHQQFLPARDSNLQPLDYESDSPNH